MKCNECNSTDNRDCICPIGKGSTTLDFLYHKYPWLKDKIENLEKELLKFKDLYIEQTTKLQEVDLKMKKNKFNVKGTTLTFKFENVEACNHFKSWLCGSGEQQYWDWMEYREAEELFAKGDITGVSFDYWNKEKIKVTCGRLDEEE